MCAWVGSYYFYAFNTNKHGMKIRRRLILETKGDKVAQKAVAMFLLLKNRLGKRCSIKEASLSKVARLLCISTNTFKRYLPVLEGMGLIEWQGKNGDVFTLKRAYASSHHRNFDVSKLSYKSFKDTYYTLRSMLFLTIQAQKDYIKQMVRIATNPRKGEDFKKARKFCNHYAHMDSNGRFVFRENGITYKKIGEIIGFCERTAQRIVNLAVKKRWVRRKTHFFYTFMPKVNYQRVDNYTFTTANYGFQVGANTYRLSPSWKRLLSVGISLEGKK